MLDGEVGYANALGQALLIHLFARPPDFLQAAPMLSGRVDEPEIDILDAESLEGALERLAHSFAWFQISELGGHEERLARELGNSLAEGVLWR